MGDPLSSNVWPATLQRVVDGDTQWFTLDLGFDTYRRIEGRLSGLDCAKAGTLEGDKATEFVTQALTGRSLLIQAQVNKGGSAKQEKWGRWLLVIQTDSSLPSLNQQLIDAGLAKPWHGQGPHPA